MNLTVQLRNVCDVKLVEELKARVQRKREALTEILSYLREVERRKLFLSRGYSSLFAFCMGELAYSESQAHSRIQAMRLLRAVPEAEEKIASGELSLSVAAAAQSAFTRSNKVNQPVALERKKKILKDLSGLSARKAEQILLEHVPAVEVPAEKTRPVTAELTRIEFNVSKELLAKLEKLKGLTGHKNFDGSWDKLFEILADVGLEKLEPKPPKADAPLLGTSQAKPRHKLSNNSRFISANVKRMVWQRDKGKCQFKDPVTGRKCESVHALQFDHVHKVSNGGGNGAENLRLMCGAHNRLRM